MSSPNRTTPGSLAALIALLVVAGCSRAPLTAPETPGVAPTSVVAPAPPSRLTIPTGQVAVTQPHDTLEAPPDWQLIQSVPVVQGVDAQVSGSHYTLRFAKGSLQKSEIITIKEYDSNVLDVEFGPSGTRFDTPVELSIDFAGTPADPRTAYADASEPVLYYLNETTNHWEAVQGGVTDWVNMKFYVRLAHFSRYALGGKAGWRQTPRTESAE